MKVLVDTAKNNWLQGIPLEWQILRIKNLFELSKEKNHGDDLPILSLTQRGIKLRDISNNEGQLAESYASYTRIRPDDLVFNPMDLRTGAVDLSITDGVISLAYSVLRKRQEVKIFLKYYKYYFQWHYLGEILFPFGQGVSVDHRWTLKDNILLNFPILIPPLENQKQIADFLDLKTKIIDQIIEKKKKLIEFLKEKRISIITQAVTKGLDHKAKMKPSGVEWIGSIPYDWKVQKISQVFLKISSGTTPASENGDYYDGEIYWIQSGDINGSILIETQKKITTHALEKYSSLKLCEPGSIVIAMYGASVGNVSLINIKAVTNQACCVLSDSKLLESKFSFYYFLASKNTLISMGQGGSQPNVSKDTIRNHKIIIPSKKDQLKIVENLNLKINTLDKIIINSESQIEYFKEYRSSLIYNAATGKIKI